MQAMIWILRHATAGPTTDAKDDDKRPLDAIGEKQARAAGIALKKVKTPIQSCVSSSLVRAHQTAELACKSLGLPVETDKRLNGSPMPVDDIKELIRGRGNTLIVTHAPSCNLIVYRFTGAQCQLTKGGLVQIHEGEVWTLWNASTCLAMAGMVDWADPQEVDHRSLDDEPFADREERMRTERRVDPTLKAVSSVGRPSWHL